MYAWGVTESEIRAAASEVGLSIFQDWQGSGITPKGRSLSFRLGLDTSQPRDEEGYAPFQRRSTSQWHQDKPRRIAAVCWHGHRDFLRALFRLQPDARVKSALADYRGSEDFERSYRATFGSGNDYHLAYGQACNCTS